MTENCRLEHTNFSCDLSLSLSSLLASSSLCDVTLVCSDGHLAAHKVILAATSSFFSSVFNLNHHNHPLIYLRGIKTEQMKAVLDFLYSGVVNVTEEGVDDFLEVANDLKIEGLMVKHKKKRKPNKRANDPDEEEQTNDVLPNDDAENSSDEIKLANGKKRKTTKKAIVDSKQENNEGEHHAEGLTNEDVEINLINQEIKEDVKKPKRKYTKRAKKPETNSEDAEKEIRKKANAASQNSLPRLIFPQSHISTSLTTMVPQTFNCPICKTRVVTSLKSHMEYKHKTKCQDCKQVFDSCNSLHYHKKGNCYPNESH